MEHFIFITLPERMYKTPVVLIYIHPGPFSGYLNHLSAVL